AGYRVGLYTSPHLLRYNERVRVQTREIADAVLCEALAATERARGDVALTFFEFSTLAAIWAFIEARVDVALLEVGLGGRLDAVNCFDADCAVLTCVDYDHMDYLGDTRESIGFEKAGVFRAGRPAICSESDVPQSVVDHAAASGARLYRIGRDFGYTEQATGWDFRGRQTSYRALPRPALQGDYQLRNAAAALAALDEMRARLAVNEGDIHTGLAEVQLPGRFQILPGRPQVILDVAHNPQAIAAIAANLRSLPAGGRTIAVFGMLADKDVGNCVARIAPLIDVWCVGDILHARGANAQTLCAVLQRQRVRGGLRRFDSVDSAFQQACLLAGENDKIIVFGSFHTVAAALRERQRAA
ncbi:MAG: bifunctional tetrahydrofolate synthase/dihydrofolate synthase, partial [Burkholderiales bacterium]